MTDQIVTRLKKPGQKVAMFPEGTTTNNTRIVHFRTGAFVAGVPVIPIVFTYPYTFWDPAFTSCSLPFHILGTLSQLISFMKVKRLPVYYPSEEEKNDPKLYAENIKKLMVKESGLEGSEESYEDKMKWETSVGESMCVCVYMGLECVVELNGAFSHAYNCIRKQHRVRERRGPTPPHRNGE